MQARVVNPSARDEAQLGESQPTRTAPVEERSSNDPVCLEQGTESRLEGRNEKLRNGNA
jgi:hypothetical protein